MGARNDRTGAPYDVIPLTDKLSQHRDGTVTTIQSAYVNGADTTNGAPPPPYNVNNRLTSYSVRQTNNQPQIFGDLNSTGERICQYYSYTNRTTDDISETGRLKSSHEYVTVMDANPSKKLKPQRSLPPASRLGSSPLSSMELGEQTECTSVSNTAAAESKPSEAQVVTTKPTSPVHKNPLKRPSVVISESTYLNLAVVVTIFFNIPIGLAAVAIAMRSTSAYRNQRIEQGRRCATMALVVSLFGVVTTVAAVMAAVQYVTSSHDGVT